MSVDPTVSTRPKLYVVGTGLRPELIAQAEPDVVDFSETRTGKDGFVTKRFREGSEIFILSPSVSSITGGLIYEARTALSDLDRHIDRLIRIKAVEKRYPRFGYELRRSEVMRRKLEVPVPR